MSDRALQELAPTGNLHDNLQREILTAAQHMREHGVVALPTDTLYGLAADVFDERALARLRAINGHPEGLPLTVLLADWEQLERVTHEFPKLARRLGQQFWPGPLTLIVPKAAWMPDLITGGRDTVSLRMPDHPVPVGVALELGRPLAGGSTTVRGQPDLLTLDAVVAELGQRVSYIVRCGPAPRGETATVVDVTTNTPRLLRHGALPFQQVLQAAGSR